MSDFDEDEAEQQQVTVIQYAPNWRFSKWDLVAATFHIAQGVAQATAEGLRHVAQSAVAHANWERQNFELEQAHAHQEAVEAEVEAHVQEILGLPEADR